MSGAVYQALHQISSLKTLRVRLDVSPSPKMVIRQGLPSNHPSAGLQQTQSLSNPGQFVPPQPSGIASTALGSYPGSKFNNIKRKKAGSTGGCNYWANPRLFSGFKHLSSLAIVGISNLECLAEVSECIRQSSASLKSLTLTLSTDLARKARKPAPVNPDLDEPSDTELEDDDLLNDPLSGPSTTTQPTPPANEADIRKEKLAQESILARVFDLQSVALEGKKIEKKLSLSGVPVFPEKDAEAITRKVNNIMKSLIDGPIASDADPSAARSRLEHFKMIREVADLYITSQNGPKKPLKEQAKPSVPAVKKSASAPKPLNPLASDFKQSGVNSSQPGLNLDWDMDSAAVNGSASSSYEACTSQPNGVQSLWPPYNDHHGLDTLTAALNKNVGPNGKSKSATTPVATTQQHLLQQAHKLAQIKAYNQQLAQTQNEAYMSPYGLGSNPHGPILPSVTGVPPHQSSQGGDPGLYDPGYYLTAPQSVSSSAPCTNGSLALTNPEPFLPTQNHTGSILKAKSKPQKAKKASNSKGSTLPETDELPGTPAKTSSPATQPFFPADPGSEQPEDTMDIDMEHPDEDTQELGEDQEILPEADDADPPTPRKRARFEVTENDSETSIQKDASLPPQAENATAVETLNPDDAMQAYIRTAHGLQLESLSLEWVPLKASILARALDMSVLKRLTLLEVGPQDNFWTLLVRLQGRSAEISFKSIHTDTVGLSFIGFLGTFEGLEELFMHEKSTKPVDESTVGPPLTITHIRRMALEKHADTLKRLMIRNERNESWDVDTKTLQFLAVKATGLRELGVSLGMKTYVRSLSHSGRVYTDNKQHVLMQYFAAFKNLYALHLLALRSGDRGVILQSESLSFAVDSLSHCADMKIRYIAIANSVVSLESKPKYMKDHLTLAMEKRRAKGKGKASTCWMLDHFEDTASDEAEEALSSIMAGESKVRIPRDFAELDDVKIFSKQIRTGRL